MPKKINCWEYMKCGREPGGGQAGKLGVCPAAAETVFDGFNRGDNAGRTCWLVAGTFCSGRIQGTFAEKQGSCKHCGFYKKIHAEEGATHLSLGPLKIYAQTHMGRVKESNEDRYLIKTLVKSDILMAIADGLGGDVAGDFAAELLRGMFAGVSDVKRNKEEDELAQLARSIDKAVHSEHSKDPELASGMGSTLIGVLYRNGRAHWVHVGDSRLYILRNRRLIQVTEDQTLARFLLAEGEITAEQVSTHYSRHVMDQFVGCGFVEPETGSLDLFPGDLMLLATDGLHREISEDALESILNADTGLKKKAESLVDAALSAGGTDNITVMLARKDAGKKKNS